MKAKGLSQFPTLPGRTEALVRWLSGCPVNETKRLLLSLLSESLGQLCDYPLSVFSKYVLLKDKEKKGMGLIRYSLEKGCHKIFFC
jgi:hypothetical protein